jgi:hypothetical protein
VRRDWAGGRTGPRAGEKRKEEKERKPAGWAAREEKEKVRPGQLGRAGGGEKAGLG